VRASLQAALDNLTVSREIVVVEGDNIVRQTTTGGIFARECRPTIEACCANSPPKDAERLCDAWISI
jgi:hypothetical protein